MAQILSQESSDSDLDDLPLASLLKAKKKGMHYSTCRMFIE